MLGLGLRLDTAWQGLAWVLIAAGGDGCRGSPSGTNARRPGPTLSSRARAGNNATPAVPGRGGHRLRTALRLTVGLAVSAICLYFATRGTDWGRVGAILAQARLGWVLAVVRGRAPRDVRACPALARAAPAGR